MIFSQSQQQAILILIGGILIFLAIASSFSEENTPILQEVNPILLEPPTKQKVSYPSDVEKVSDKKEKLRKYSSFPPKSTMIPSRTKQKPVKMAIDLNLADSTQLDEVPGIGPTLARRILKYRSLIGQFIEVEQLQMVYGLSLENYQRMAPHFVISHTEMAEKLDLNGTKSYKIAWFVGKDKAKLLVALRKQKGWFEAWEAVEVAELFDTKEIRWLKAYFFIKKRDTPKHVSSPK